VLYRLFHIQLSFPLLRVSSFVRLWVVSLTRICSWIGFTSYPWTTHLDPRVSDFGHIMEWRALAGSSSPSWLHRPLKLLCFPFYSRLVPASCAQRALQFHLWQSNCRRFPQSPQTPSPSQMSSFTLALLPIHIQTFRRKGPNMAHSSPYFNSTVMPKKTNMRYVCYVLWAISCCSLERLTLSMPTLGLFHALSTFYALPCLLLPIVISLTRFCFVYYSS